MNRCRNNNMAKFISFLVIMGGTIASAGLPPFLSPPPGMDPNEVISLDWEALSRYTADWEDRLARETYRKDGAEVVPWTQEAALPSPDNAALLYYQAFLLRPQPDDATYLRINAVLGGAEPDELIRTYLGNCQPMIHTSEIAAQIPQCT